MSEFHSATMTRVRGCDHGNRGGGGLVRGLYKGDKGKGAAVALYPIITLAAILRGLPFPNVGGTGESFNTFRLSPSFVLP